MCTARVGKDCVCGHGLNIRIRRHVHLARACLAKVFRGSVIEATCKHYVAALGEIDGERPSKPCIAPGDHDCHG